MGWVKFEKAEQAAPGAKMRPESTTKRRGRYKSYVVVRREIRPTQGNLIIFEDGSMVSLVDAKSWWLVESK